MSSARSGVWLAAATVLAIALAWVNVFPTTGPMLGVVGGSCLAQPCGGNIQFNCDGVPGCQTKTWNECNTSPGAGTCGGLYTGCQFPGCIHRQGCKCLLEPPP